jgi:hypothetical protein
MLNRFRRCLVGAAMTATMVVGAAVPAHAAAKTDCYSHGSSSTCLRIYYTVLSTSTLRADSVHLLSSDAAVKKLYNLRLEFVRDGTVYYPPTITKTTGAAIGNKTPRPETVYARGRIDRQASPDYDAWYTLYLS